jgi:hypothetical protein
MNSTNVKTKNTDKKSLQEKLEEWGKAYEGTSYHIASSNVKQTIRLKKSK